VEKNEMKHPIPLLARLFGLSLLLLSACISRVGPTGQPSAGMPNPASVYCEEQGYRVEIRTAEDGSQSGVCVFPEGECDEWAYFRGECNPPGEAPDDVIPPAGDGGDDEPDEVNRIADLVKGMLAGQLGISPDEILFAALEEVNWPDACLGLPNPGETCAEVITPGYRITLTVGEDRYDFRTDGTGTIVRQEPPVE
jgi:putative hemolysin